MVQIYFLSIVLNGLVGFILIYGAAKEDSADETNAQFFFTSGGFRLILGIISVVVGILKFLSPMKTLILGDLVPALAGLVAGFVLVFGFYRERTSRTGDEGRFGSFGETLLCHKKAVGVGLLVCAVLHFLFPRALFL